MLFYCLFPLTLPLVIYRTLPIAFSTLWQSILHLSTSALVFRSLYYPPCADLYFVFYFFFLITLDSRLLYSFLCTYTNNISSFLYTGLLCHHLLFVFFQQVWSLHNLLIAWKVDSFDIQITCCLYLKSAQVLMCCCTDLIHTRRAELFYSHAFLFY